MKRSHNITLLLRCVEKANFLRGYIDHRIDAGNADDIPASVKRIRKLRAQCLRFEQRIIKRVEELEIFEANAERELDEICTKSVLVIYVPQSGTVGGIERK